jgi:hypothetical protein
MVLLLFFWLGFAAVVAVAASNRGHSGAGWFFLALLISPLLAGLFLLASRDLRVEALLRASNASDGASKVCPRCAERVKLAAFVCRFCEHEFAGDIPHRSAPASSPIDPFELARQGKVALHNKLLSLDHYQLKRVAFDCNMNEGGLADRWKRDDLISHIESEALNAVRNEPPKPIGASSS